MTSADFCFVFREEPVEFVVSEFGEVEAVRRSQLGPKLCGTHWSPERIGPAYRLVVPRYVALLRAINTPGRNIKMDRLRSAFEATGCESVETFIASGNVIFDGSGPVDVGAIESALAAEAGFEIPVYLRTGEEVVAVADRRPFGSADGEVEISFLPATPDPGAVNELLATATGSDRLAVIDREVYWLHNGPRREPAHSEVEVMRILDMPTTQRSDRTVRRIADKYLR
jgi:uncharacterized protein (DUF1697 family)